MKRIIIFCLSLILNTIIATSPKENAYQIDINSIWKDLDATSKNNTQDVFGGKWILAGTFIFRNKTGDPVPMQELSLAWKSTIPLQNLHGSLFKKEPHEGFLPLEENLVSDGHWNKDKQILHFKFKEQQYIGIKTIFFLVLTVPSHIEEALKEGFFSVIIDNLPRQLKKAVSKKIPTLSISPRSVKLPISTNRLAFKHALKMSIKS